MVLVVIVVKHSGYCIHVLKPKVLCLEALSIFQIDPPFWFIVSVLKNLFAFPQMSIFSLISYPHYLIIK